MAHAERTVSVERTIAADPSTIFALLSDPRRHAEIDGSHTVKTATGPDRLKQGDTFSMAIHRGIRYRMINTVVEYEQDRCIAWQPFPPFPLSLLVGGRIWRYQLEPVAGGTRVVESWDISHERIPVLVARDAGTARRAMEATLARIEEICVGT